MVLHDFVYVRVKLRRVSQAQEHTKHTAQHIYFLGVVPIDLLRVYASHLLLLHIIIIVITNWRESKVKKKLLVRVLCGHAREL